jgi:tetratricopeptide (TPR) repeat protein
MLRRAPEEEDVYLVLSDAYLGLEYYADSLAQIRSYVKLAKQKSEPDLRSAFKKVMDADVRNPHLLDELSSLYADSGIEDLELQRRLSEYVDSRLASREYAASASPSVEDLERPQVETSPMARAAASDDSSVSGLVTLDHTGLDEEPGNYPSFNGSFGSTGNGSFDFKPNAESSEVSEPLPSGEGKDHYDLGIVYREMKLWDAAISEFEQARRDPSLRLRATLALSECMQESGDLQGALTMLEREKDQNTGSPSERMGLNFQLGVIYELIGNLEQALEQFQIVQSQNGEHEAASQKVQELSRRLGKRMA